MKKRPIDIALEKTQDKGWNQTELANRLGVLPQHVSNWIKRGLPTDKYAAVADVLGCSVDELLGRSAYHGYPADAASISYAVKEEPAVYNVNSTDITIPQYDPMELAGSMGRGLELRDQPGVIQSWRVSKDWLHQNVKAHSGNANLCIVTGFGDSMQPMFNPGDPLLVDIGVTSVEFDSVYFFRVGNEGFIKRLQRIPTENGLLVRAISENKTAYESFDITTKMDFQVLGRVLKVWRSQEF